MNDVNVVLMIVLALLFLGAFTYFLIRKAGK